LAFAWRGMAHQEGEAMFFRIRFYGGAGGGRLQ